MNLIHKFTRISVRSKILIGAAVAAVAVGIPVFTQAALGDNRETKAYVQGMQGLDRVQFNSFNGVPSIGDERNFVTGKINNGAVGYYDPMNNVKVGDELVVRVYVDNNAAESLNANGTGVARNTKVRVTLPTGQNQNQSLAAFISADNAAPQVIEDGLSITAPTAVSLAYVPGSATITTAKLNNVALSDAIITDGVLIGDDALDGNIDGGFNSVAEVFFKVKLDAPAYSLATTVRPDTTGTGGWTEEVSVKPGDQVDFSLNFKNTGTTTLDKVAIGNRLPVGLTYVPGTTEWISGHTNGQWTKITNENWFEGGLDIGGYLPDANAIVHFTAKVTDVNALSCGDNLMVNHAFAKPVDKDNLQDSATVKVTKDCAETSAPTSPTPAPTPTPTPSPAPAEPIMTCGALTIDKAADSRKITVTDFTFVGKNGASFKHAVIDWGDGTSLTTDVAKAKDHTFANDGTFTIKATPYFTIPGQTTPVAAPESNACQQTVTFATTAVTPVAAAAPAAPDTLVATGPGGIAALFAAVTTIAATVHHLFVRRLAR